MKEYTKLNWSFWLSLLAFVISIVALAVFFCKVGPYSVVSIDTFIGVIAGFIGIAVTLLVGYQIYNAINLRERIKAVEKLKYHFETQQAELEYVKLEFEESLRLIQAKIYHETGDELNAFIFLHSAIKYSLHLLGKKESFDLLLDQLGSYMLKISMASFASYLTPEESLCKVNKLKELYKDNDRSIRENPNYFCIKRRYEELMSKFEIRLNNISNCKNVSFKEIDKLAEGNE